ncbi:hypothetical protein K437DRAFT_251225 [Tilletiaria anomala UBC 951]|uniref:Uncharacterized protein n=1 Tax=Tilletiaria anomala (strain ATCC 24038 / CBS 436.72 / UBC 951) TaxID=1037660 RepID=A0A066VE41_TILAU|nr:uncharacterized protein K437DRAFT_251225 [Tilletiaria anomala UBC 951]KDN38573.1 hypothetical protein K437DRAFT_251225 [Tilletiaria anomala UBC 951]
MYSARPLPGPPDGHAPGYLTASYTGHHTSPGTRPVPLYSSPGAPPSATVPSNANRPGMMPPSGPTEREMMERYGASPGHGPYAGPGPSAYHSGLPAPGHDPYLDYASARRQEEVAHRHHANRDPWGGAPPPPPGTGHMGISMPPNDPRYGAPPTSLQSQGHPHAMPVPPQHVPSGAGHPNADAQSGNPAKGQSALPSAIKSGSRSKARSGQSAHKERNGKHGGAEPKTSTAVESSSSRKSGGASGSKRGESSSITYMNNGTVTNSVASTAAAAPIAAASAAVNTGESKRDKKRREVIDRMHRVHWDTLENRDVLYQELQMALSNSYATLLASPSHFRTYNLAMARLTLERDAELRQSALLHAYKVESARQQHESEMNKIEEEARVAKKNVREQLMKMVEERRRKLKEEKENGEIAMDSFIEQAQRSHPTRSLRNKAHGGSRARGRGLMDDADEGDKGNVANGGLGTAAAAAAVVVNASAGDAGADGRSGVGYLGIGTAANGLGSLLQNQGHTSAQVLGLITAGRLGLQFNGPSVGAEAKGKGNGKSKAQIGDTTGERPDAKDTDAIMTSGDAPGTAEGLSTTTAARAAKVNGFKRTFDQVAMLEAIAAMEASKGEGTSSGDFVGMDAAPVNGFYLTPAAFLDALGLGGPGSGVGAAAASAGGLNGILEGTGAHAPSIIVGPGGPNSAKSKKKAKAAAAAAAATAAASIGADGAAEGAAGSSAVALNGSLVGAASQGTGGSSAAAAAAAVAAAGPGGRLRWDVGKSLQQLTAAKDFEIESDLIGVRKIGGKRSRRR